MEQKQKAKRLQPALFHASQPRPVSSNRPSQTPSVDSSANQTAVQVSTTRSDSVEGRAEMKHDAIRSAGAGYGRPELRL